MAQGQVLKKGAKHPAILAGFKKLFRWAAPFNRRLDRRFGFSQPLSCTCAYQYLGRTQECQAMCVDVSRGGMLLMTAATKIEPRVDAAVTFSPRQGAAVTVRGKVVRTFRLQAEKFYFSGIRFSDRKQPGIAFLLISSTPPA